MHTACVWSEKLPFAGYSVVKDHSGGNIAPRILWWSRGAFPRTPFARSLVGPKGPTPFACVNHSGLRPEPRLGRSRGPFAPLRFLAARSLAFAHSRVAQPQSFKDRRVELIRPAAGVLGA